MENSSKALLIAGAILLAILLIGVGMYTYNSTSTSVTASTDSMSTHETDAFNNQFTMYDGEKNGSDVKKLIGTLISNSSTYKDELNKVPSFVIDNKINLKDSNVENATRPEDSKHVDEYVTQLSTIRNNIEQNHKYTIELSYDSTGLIGEIKLIY